MTTNEAPVRGLKGAMVAGIVAFLLIAALLQLLSHHQVSAQQVEEVAAPDLSVEKTVNATKAEPGAILTYVVRIANPGEGVTAWMTDELPPKVTYVDHSLVHFGPGSVGYASGAINWTYENFGWGQTAVVTFSAQVSPEITKAQIVNTAQVTGSGELGESSVQTSVEPAGEYSYTMRFPFFVKHWPPLPYAPVLYDIVSPPIGGNDYTVKWSHEYTTVTVISYTLQEATNASFIGAVEYEIPHAGTLTEKQFTDKPDGTYYYRVAGHNDYGRGPWSNTKSVTVFTVYFDDFSNTGSGWPVSSGDIKDDRGVVHGQWYRRYKDGDYQLYVEDGTCRVCDWWVQPAALAPYTPPTNKYCVETKMKFERGHYWANMGLVFGATDDYKTLYAACLSRDVDADKLHWFIVRQDDYDVKLGRTGCSKPEFGIGGYDWDGTSRYDWNHVKVSVDGDTIKLYIGGYYKGKFKLDGLTAMTRVGVVGGDAEIPPTDIRYQWFKVTPNAECTP
jgi:uncharacterized repeat protein (TIGR01451 family)